MKLLFEPRLKVMDKINFCPGEPEMTEYESAVLCGVIAEKNPKKILEIGVAAGGTTTIIMQCLDDLNINASVISCDLNELYYRNNKLKTGFIYENNKNVFCLKMHRFMLGKYLPEFLDDIGNDIDIAIIDTIHTMPGEVLDFLAVLPFMKSDGVVIFHDVAFSYYYNNCLCSNAVLMASVVGNRIKVGEDEGRPSGYPNIGGVYLNEDTLKYVGNTFSALLLDWEYVPSDRELEIYRKHFKRFYDDDNLDLFNKAVYNNKHNVHNWICKKLMHENDNEIVRSLFDNNETIAFWGRGAIGEFWERMFLKAGVDIKYIIDGKGKGEKDGNGIVVKNPRMIAFDSVKEIIIIMSSRYDKEIEENLINMGVKKYCTYKQFIKKVCKSILELR